MADHPSTSPAPVAPFASTWTDDDEAELLALAEPDDASSQPRRECMTATTFAAAGAALRPETSSAGSTASGGRSSDDGALSGGTTTTAGEGRDSTRTPSRAVKSPELPACVSCRRLKAKCVFDASTGACAGCTMRQIECSPQTSFRIALAALKTSPSTSTGALPQMGLFKPSSSGTRASSILRSPDRDELPTVPLSLPRSSIDRAISPSTGSESLTPLSSPAPSTTFTPERRPPKVVTFASPLLSEDDAHFVVEKRSRSSSPVVPPGPAPSPADPAKLPLGKRLRLVACSHNGLPTAYLQLAGDDP